MIREWLLRRAEAIMASRPHDFAIGPPDDRYLLRWIVTPWANYDRNSAPRNAWEAFKRRAPAIYVHRFRHDDEDRALHDHPWNNASIVLTCGYWEVVPQDPLRPAGETKKVFRPEGSVTFRRAEDAHRVVLLRRYPSEKMVPRAEMESVEAVTIFLLWFRRREFGFHCPKGWVHWKVFTDARDRGATGRGCE